MNGPTFTPQSAPPVAPAGRPTPPRPAPPKPAKPDAVAGGVTVLTYLRLHWMTILFCGGLLGGGLAYAAWTLLPGKYESYALLHVASTPNGVGAGGDPNRGKTEFVTYLKTTAQLIKSEFVLNAALNDPKYRIAELPTLKEQKDPIKYLDEKLVVGSSDTEVIKISLEGDRPEDVQKIVDAVKDAYYQEVVMKEINQKKAFMLTVEQAKATLESAMKNKPGFVPVQPALANGQTAPRPNGVVQADARLPAVPMADPVLTPVGGTLPVPPAGAAVVAGAIGDTELVKKAKFPILVNRIAAYEIEIAQFPTVIKERQAVVDSIKKQIEALKAGEPSQESLARAEKDPDVMSKDVAATARRREYAHLREVINDPSADRIARAKAAAEAAEADAAKVKAEKAKLFETLRKQAQIDQLYRSLDAAEINVASFKERERVTAQMLADARKEVAEIPPDIKKGEEKGPLVDPQKTDLLTHDDMYRRLTAQLIGLDFELQSPPRVRKLQDASVPSQKDAKKQILATVMAGLMGFGLIGLVAVGYEVRVKKVSSLGELRATGPTPVVGVVPWQPDGSALRDPVKRADVNEAIDKLRAYVTQTWLSRGATTVAVTSPLGDEGKAFTAFGLASSLAQAGYKTLLIDFDLRHPALHPFAGVPHGAVGVCELLRGETDPRSAVLALPNGLYFLPAGQWSDEARQAAVGGRLEALLARLREPFDCVVLHGHALLTAAESVEVARRADVVLLCTLYRETRLPLLKRAVERVAAMEVPYSGVVYLGATANEALC